VVIIIILFLFWAV